jgi:hypothetical protein
VASAATDYNLQTNSEACSFTFLFGIYPSMREALRDRWMTLACFARSFDGRRCRRRPVRRWQRRQERMANSRRRLFVASSSIGYFLQRDVRCRLVSAWRIEGGGLWRIEGGGLGRMSTRSAGKHLFLSSIFMLFGVGGVSA